MEERVDHPEIMAVVVFGMKAVWRFVFAAIIIWMVLSLVITTLIPLGYPKEMEMVEGVEERIVCTLVIGSLSGAALDVAQWRRRQMRKASMVKSQRVSD